MATVKTFLTILNLLLYSCFCSDTNCKDGECKPIKDTTQVICECHNMCLDTCLVKPCGVNAKCSSSNRDRSCSCVGPWKGDPYEGCRSQDLQWVQTREVPSNAVRSKTQLVVCKAIGPDSGWHSGFVKDQRCNYEYNWSKHQANNYEVLVDPCGGSGWKWVEGEQQNMVSYDKSVRFQESNTMCVVEKVMALWGSFSTREMAFCAILPRTIPGMNISMLWFHNHVSEDTSP
ncbi:uncharacterized protein LOC131535889 [Onychostoma macrolepis]|uniref:EGF-like domain-containing protein n=1 Tax=Onychostoma macrolepis TaxID=369639 RepID=A0A7J6D770_9TELE|nr:uncharacterized protein LOC131535889 [Onychostoma macrolepis]XP_058624397.1 uncharacterized protein LOC131535889 [Onychostoma macrolepis]XP_058624398.1 uncharacterized protein LOC131535889 [Onychostoma macrolepis]XP_058624399.1 uncharacterized protein LOC131535889 [Onychostoma macrolepis]KAF4115116.1 hypothetical protein G5714_002605 [Onychostoma macrolepis]